MPIQRCQHTSAYVSIRQHTLAHAHTALPVYTAYVSVRQYTLAHAHTALQAYMLTYEDARCTVV
jgi:hypothetical protein